MSSVAPKAFWWLMVKERGKIKRIIYNEFFNCFIMFLSIKLSFLGRCEEFVLKRQLDFLQPFNVFEKR